MENTEVKLTSSPELAKGDSEAHKSLLHEVWSNAATEINSEILSTGEKFLGTALVVGAFTFAATRGNLSSIAELGGALFNRGVGAAAELADGALARATGKAVGTDLSSPLTWDHPVRAIVDSDADLVRSMESKGLKAPEIKVKVIEGSGSKTAKDLIDERDYQDHFFRNYLHPEKVPFGLKFTEDGQGILVKRNEADAWEPYPPPEHIEPKIDWGPPPGDGELANAEWKLDPEVLSLFSK